MTMTPMQGEVVEIGQFTVKSGVLEVTDPCYGPGTDHVLEGVRCGKWVAETEIADGRNSCITVRHIDYPMEDYFVFESSDIGVDSGQAGFFDAARYVGGDDQEFYDMVCDLTLNTENCAGVIEFGAVSSSGWGDGCYELQTIRQGDEVVAARIVFMVEESDESEDEEENEGDEEGSDEVMYKKSRYNF